MCGHTSAKVHFLKKYECEVRKSTVSDGDFDSTEWAMKLFVYISDVITMIIVAHPLK